jgi:hypothetical protein
MVVAVCAAIGLVVPLAGASVASAAAPKNVVYYGDSLTSEAHWQITSQYATKSGWVLHLAYLSGIPLCNLIPVIQNDIATLHPYRIVIETFGNVGTSCTEEPDGSQIAYGSPDWLALYQSNFETILATTDAAGTRVTLVDSPMTSTPGLNTAETALNGLMSTEAQAHHKVSVAPGPSNAVETNGQYTLTKPCTTAEKADPNSGCGTPKKGQIIVRAPDGVHFCPVGYPDGSDGSEPCAVYSSGAVRYGNGMVTAGTAPPAPFQQ